MVKSSAIAQHTHDLIAMQTFIRQTERKMMDAYLRSDGDLASALEAARHYACSQATNRPVTMMYSDCPEGWHDEGGVCVPD